MRSEEILELLKIHPAGLNNKELGRFMGMNPRSVKNITRVLFKEGSIHRVGWSVLSRWCLPENIDSAYQALNDERHESRLRLREQNNNSRRKRLEKKRMNKPEPIFDPDKPRQIVVSAKDAKPLPVIGVRSIFELCLSKTVFRQK